MKTNILIIVFFILKGLSISAQEVIPYFKNMTESVLVVTDRDTYCVNEKIQYKVLNTTSVENLKNDWSKIVYIELLTPSGIPLVQQKNIFSKNGSSGEIYIPETILSGNYYLRCYTKWMRNFSANNFSYKLIKIVNPYSKQLLKGDTNTNVLIDTLKFNKSNYDVKILFSSSKYSQRKKVKLTIENISEINGYDLSVSISKVNTNRVIVPLLQDNKFNFTNDFVPELRGISLSGKLIDKNTSKGIKNEYINLTVFDSVPKNYSTISNKNGEFYFALPDINRKIEIFLTTSAHSNGIDPIILVDNDFCSKAINLPFIPFIIDNDEEILLNELSINSQIKNKYSDLIEKKNEQKKSIASFYGEPDFVLNIEDYIPLTNIQDYFKEVITSVNVVKQNKNVKLRIMGVYPELSIYEPLVLIDYVTINKIDNLLKLPPSKISRIEVIEQPYIRGNNIFGGIINIISTKGDFGGVSLPESGLFFKFSMLENQFVSINSSEKSKRIPKLHNTLYWNPNIHIDNGQSKQVEFFTGDNSGEYEIVISFINSEGLLEVVNEFFTVK